MTTLFLKQLFVRFATAAAACRLNLPQLPIPISFPDLSPASRGSRARPVFLPRRSGAPRPPGSGQYPTSTCCRPSPTPPPPPPPRQSPPQPPQQARRRRRWRGMLWTRAAWQWWWTVDRRSCGRRRSRYGLLVGPGGLRRAAGHHRVMVCTCSMRMACVGAASWPQASTTNPPGLPPVIDDTCRWPPCPWDPTP